MREINFRGKRVDNGEWVIGNFLETSMSGVYIIGAKMKSKKKADAVVIQDEIWQCEVLDETVGQFTGLFDKNGKEIFEGDVVIHDVYVAKYEKGKRNGIIVFFNGAFAINLLGSIYDDEYSTILPFMEMEVIGNELDNPELLKRGEKE